MRGKELSDVEKLRITEKLVNRAGIRKSVSVEELGSAMAVVSTAREKAEEQAAQRRRADRRFTPAETTVALRIFQSLKADASHPNVQDFLKEQDHFASDRKVNNHPLQRLHRTAEVVWLKWQDRGTRSRETGIAVATFTGLSQDAEGNITHQEVFHFLQQQHQQALAKEANGGGVRQVSRLQEKEKVIRRDAGTFPSRRRFLQQSGVLMGSLFATGIGIERIPDTNESLAITKAEMQKKCEPLLDQAMSEERTIGQREPTAKQIQQGMDYCVAYKYSDYQEGKQYLDPQEWRRLLNMSLVFVGGGATIYQIWKKQREIRDSLSMKSQKRTSSW